jgi:hypothetical protein
MKTVRRTLLTISSFLLVTGEAHGQLSGATLRLQDYFPNMSSPSADYGLAVVGGGTEWSGIFIGQVDVSATGVRIFWPNSVFWSGAEFNGLRISDPFNTAPAFTGYSDFFYSGDPERRIPDITVMENDIWINLAGSSLWGGVSELSFTVHTAAAPGVVPEPASVVLVGSGLLLLGGAAARRRKNGAR